MTSLHKEGELAAGQAEAAFREAFERLKLRRPTNLPAHSPVTQNNVAREAGKDPSALKKSRFPDLVDEIQRHIQARDAKKSQRKDELATAEQVIERLKADLARALTLRDQALSQLMTAELTILELTTGAHVDNNTSNVSSIHKKRDK